MNPSALAALWFQTPARLGPVICSPGLTEWQAMHWPKIRAPRFASPAEYADCAIATATNHNKRKNRIAISKRGPNARTKRDEEMRRRRAWRRGDQIRKE